MNRFISRNLINHLSKIILLILYTITTFILVNCGDSFHLLFDEQRKLISIEITPAVNSIPKGTFFKYAAIGTFSDATTEDLTDTVTWIV